VVASAVLYAEDVMQVDAVLTKDDLPELLGQFAPLTIRLGKHGQLIVSDPRDITLIPGAGARVCCKGKLNWTVLGLDVPVTLNSLILILRPEILDDERGNALVFKVEIEHIDLAGVPEVLDDGITDKVNRELAANHVELSWNYVRTLSHTFKLPESLEPLESLDLRAAGGRVLVTAEAIRFSVPFHTAVRRRADAT
jgi:hypothetical protein